VRVLEKVVTAYCFETLGLIRIDALVRTDNAASVRVLEKVVTAYCFETLGLIRIDALVRTDNAASVRVLEKVGYQREGLLRRAILQDGVPVDHLLYAILLED
jgi:RimJ/RimL family protein N-acetyltransferase